MAEINSKALRTLTYGLFLVTAQSGGRDNGCISNSAMQVSGSPYTLALSVNKGNLTHDMIAESGKFNLSILTESAPFEVFDHYGLHSGRELDKFAGTAFPRTENGLLYLPYNTNAIISAEVKDSIDCGTHTLFHAVLTEAMTLDGGKSMSYDYYFANVKPKPQPKKKGWVCTICGYVHEAEELPADFVCPLCSHGAEYFQLA